MSLSRLKTRLSLQQLFSHELFKGFASMSIGTFSGQIITLLALPIISRLYTPQDFGVLSLVIAASVIILPAVGLKFEYALLIPLSRREMRVLIGLAIMSVLVLSVLWSFFVLLTSKLFFGEHSIPYIGFWVFGITFGTGLFNVFVQIAIREQKYHQVGVSAFLQSGTTGLSQSVLGVIHWSHLGLLTGLIIGQLVSLTALVHKFRFDLGRFSPRDIPKIIRKHWRFPALFAPSAMLNSFGLQLPIITISAIFGLTATGQLGIAERIVAIPIALIGGPIGQLFVGEMSKMLRNEHKRFVSFFLRITFALLAASIVLFGTLIITSPWLVPLFLGNQWVDSVPLIQIISIMAAIRLTFSPTAMALTLFQKARANMILDAVRVAFVAIGALVVTMMDLGLYASTAILYSGLSIIYIITWIYVLFMLRARSKYTKI